MTHAPTSPPFDLAAARAFMAVLRAGLFVLAEWLLRWFGAEERMPRHVKLEVRAMLRDARDDLLAIVLETMCSRLAPTPRKTTRGQRITRWGKEGPVASHISRINIRRLLKRNVMAPGRTLRARFARVFWFLRRFETAVARVHARMLKRAKGAWVVADVAPSALETRTLEPCFRDNS